MQRRHLAGAVALAATLPAIGFPTPARAGAPESRRLAELFAETLTAHDLKAFAALFAEDYQQYQTSAATPPPPAGLSGKQATIGFFTARLAGLPDLTVTAAPIVAAEDSVAANYTYTGTHTAPYFGIAPTGRRVTFTSCDIFAIRGGLISAHWGMGDLAGLIAQLRA